jgi:Zn-finger nucleic acid-binding protein
MPVNCPACGHQLSAHEVGDITVDVCRGGCGGIWFDNFELQKVDESFEAADEGLLQVEYDPKVVVDHAARRQCPCCDDTVMMRHHFSVRREVEVDQCPRCNGYFLDRGELGAIRGQFASEEARREAARQSIEDLFGDALEAQADASEDEVQRAQGFARMMRFLLPSFWLKGKQPWGAY